MSMPVVSPKPNAFALMLGWKRLLFTLATAIPLGLLLSISSSSPVTVVVGRSILVGLIAMLAFGLTERWPAHLPGWLARWVLQLVAVVVAVPLGALFAYWVTLGGNPQFGQNQARVVGYMSLTVLGIMVALWIALGAMVRQRDELARNQALAFELERSELARQALDTRMHLLQAQVQPHFLFNTLANVQALVETGSPQASKVLDSLIAYLRAAVPRLHDPTTTLGQEAQLARAYLHARPLAVLGRCRCRGHGSALSAYDIADSSRERSPPRHRSERAGRTYRSQRAGASGSMPRASYRYRRRAARWRRRTRDRAV